MKLYPDRKRTRATRVFWQAAQRMRDAGITVDTDPSYSTVSIDAPGQESIFMQGDEADSSLPSVASCGTGTLRFRWMLRNWRSPNHIQTFGVNHVPKIQIRPLCSMSLL